VSSQPLVVVHNPTQVDRTRVALTDLSLTKTGVDSPKCEKDFDGDQLAWDGDRFDLDKGQLNVDVVVVIVWRLNKRLSVVRSARVWKQCWRIVVL
jgi:hypothetical protein